MATLTGKFRIGVVAAQIEFMFNAARGIKIATKHCSATNRPLHWLQPHPPAERAPQQFQQPLHRVLLQC